MVIVVSGGGGAAVIRNPLPLILNHSHPLKVPTNCCNILGVLNIRGVGGGGSGGGVPKP